jgi:hypothetical protein
MSEIDSSSTDEAWNDYIESIRRWMDITIKDYNGSEE